MMFHIKRNIFTRTCYAIFFSSLFLCLFPFSGAWAQQEGPQEKKGETTSSNPYMNLGVPKKAANKYMELGTSKGEMGGDKQQAYDRSKIKDQIKSFIPPLLRPAITQHAYILPPGAFSAQVSHRHTVMNGDDFFMNGKANAAVFGGFRVERDLTDFDLFYGFDLNRKYLHGFTLRVNVPYLNSQTDGFVHPNGQSFIFLENAGSTQGIGDIGLFLKKKIFDQGNMPFGLAAVGAVFLPTGANKDTFGSNGRITAIRPQAPPDDPATPGVDESQALVPGFDNYAMAMVAAGNWGDPRCFFNNFNNANPGLCGQRAFSVPSAGPLSFADGGPNAGNRLVGDFPFNNGVFGRFAGDGRLPSTLQPGTGDFSFLAGLFLTRQFDNGDILGRSALHLGVAHKFIQKKDGVNFGDTTTYFASFVKPVIRDRISLDLSFVGFDHEKDHYDGKIPEPEIHTCTASDIAATLRGCGAVGAEVFLFDLVDRPSFSGGFTGLFAPSLIYSPDPQIRFTASALFRVIEPSLGPAPPTIYRLSLDFTY